MNENDLGEVSGGSISEDTMKVFVKSKIFGKSKRAILAFLKNEAYPAPMSVVKIEND